MDQMQQISNAATRGRRREPRTAPPKSAGGVGGVTWGGPVLLPTEKQNNNNSAVHVQQETRLHDVGWFWALAGLVFGPQSCFSGCRVTLVARWLGTLVVGSEYPFITCAMVTLHSPH